MSNSEQNKAETLADLGRQCADADVRVTDIAHPANEANHIPCALEITSDGAETIVPLRDVLEILDSREPLAQHRAGTVQLTDAESLIAYVKRYGSERTIVYANASGFSFTAVMDDHPVGPAGTPEDKAGWRRHRASYACPRSAEWIAWTALDGKAQRQTAFADFIEERLADLVVAEGMPKPTDMLQVARNLNIRTKGEVRREVNPTNGDYVMVNKQETTSESTQIPRAFVIGVPVFDGGERYQVECRVRFVLSDGGAPSFAFIMHRRAEIERDAFMGVRAMVATETKRLILSGNP